jgi:hypothetical protein
MRRIFVLLSSLLCLLFSSAEASQVAVWNPEKAQKGNRFKIDLTMPGEVVSLLEKNQIQAQALTTAQLNDPAVFSSGKFDALIMEGTYIPKPALEAIEKFSDDGGVIILLSSVVPFVSQVEPGDDGLWDVTPKGPGYAWQRPEILRYFGLRFDYVPEKHDLGVEHVPTPLWLKYQPKATTLSAKLTSSWVTPEGDAAFYSLMHSLRVDHEDATPSLYVMKKGTRTTIVSTSPIFTRKADPKLWPDSDGTVVGLAKLAIDLKQGKVTLSDDMKVAIRRDMDPPEPLRTRHVRGSVEPEQATPLVRWGKFDGSSAELGELLAKGTTRSVAAGADSRDVPRGLAGGASCLLAIAPATANSSDPAYLRVRGAYGRANVGLKISLGDEVIHHERFIYTVGQNALQYTGLPVEFTRLIFLPEGIKGKSLKLENTGSEKLYFDAIQIETRSKPAPDMEIGVGCGYKPSALTPEQAQVWGPIRTSLRMGSVTEANDPNRWKAVDKLVSDVMRLNRPVHLILEGTPPWAPISKERYEEAVRAKRPTTCPPDTAKFVELVGDLVAKYKGKVEYYEIWNEADIDAFWRGTPQEYVSFFKSVVPKVRELDPKAKVVCVGMAFYNEKFIDSAIDAGLMESADLIGFHPYCGKVPAWDLPISMLEGYLFSRGIDKEIYSDESGFPYDNREWSPPPVLTPKIQGEWTNIAMARALSNGLNKLNVFHAGADGHPFGLIAGDGKPYPGYYAHRDYCQLGLKGARRMDISVVRADGEPTAGIYTAAASHNDGSETIIINPCESNELESLPDLSTEFDSLNGWTPFFGKTVVGGGVVKITPLPEKGYAGFYTKGNFSVANSPLLEVSIPECAGTWSMNIKLANGKTVPVFKDQKSGVFKEDLRTLMDGAPDGPVEVSFRITGETSFDYVHFGVVSGGKKEKSMSLRVKFPLQANKSYAGELVRGEDKAPVKIDIHKNGTNSWGEAVINLQDDRRHILTVTPGA